MATLRLSYRPEIDGIRAFAVTSVIVYHAFPDLLPGGFIGVDIFFVISGYLISGILFREGSERTFSLKAFYLRRIKRLLPALLVLFFVVFAYGFVVLLAGEFKNLAESSLSSAFFIQNIALYFEDTYFAAESRAKPLMHLWSLSVEEQFYIFLPGLLSSVFFCYTTNQQRKKRWAGSALGAIFLASLVSNLVQAQTNTSAAFFLPQNRVWEFLAGTALAYCHFTGTDIVPRHVTATLKVFLAIVFILVSCMFFDSSDPFPGWRALLPVVGSVLLIDSARFTFLFRVLANPAVRYIGLISYPLYLFHWPALSFVHIIMGYGATPRYVIGALCVAGVMSVATYEMAEKPIRRLPAVRTVLPLVGGLLAFCCLCLLVVCGVLGKQTKNELQLIETALEDKNLFAGFQDLSAGSGLEIYKVGEERVKTVFFGDSNMQQYAPRIAELVKKGIVRDRGALFITQTGTLPIPSIDKDGESNAQLFEYLGEILAKDPGVDRIVVCGLWKVYFRETSTLTINGTSLGSKEGREKAFVSLEAFLSSLSAAGKKVYVVSTMPIGYELDPRNHIERSFFGVSRREQRPSLSKDELESRNPEIKRLLKQASAAAGAHFIDSVDFLALDGLCLYEDADGPIRFDGNHLRPHYVRERVVFLDQTMTP